MVKANKTDSRTEIGEEKKLCSLNLCDSFAVFALKKLKKDIQKFIIFNDL